MSRRWWCQWLGLPLCTCSCCSPRLGKSSSTLQRLLQGVQMANVTILNCVSGVCSPALDNLNTAAECDYEVAAVTAPLEHARVIRRLRMQSLLGVLLRRLISFIKCNDSRECPEHPKTDLVSLQEQVYGVVALLSDLNVVQNSSSWLKAGWDSVNEEVQFIVHHLA